MPEKFQKSVTFSIQSPPFASSIRPNQLPNNQLISFGSKSWGQNLETGQSSSIPDTVRGLSHRTSFLNLHHSLSYPLLRCLEGRNFCGSFGRFRQCSATLLLCSTAAEQHSGGESRGVGGMSPLGSRHLDTRSSRGIGYTRSNV